jgi:glycosyltransferase involved in cell wall biosynthesis
MLPLKVAAIAALIIVGLATIASQSSAPVGSRDRHALRLSHSSVAWSAYGTCGPGPSPAAWQADGPQVLVLAYPEWKGIFSAALAQGAGVLCVPENFDSYLFSRARRLADLVAATPSVKTVVVHGLFPGYLVFAEALKSVAPLVRTVVVYHGSVALPWADEESQLLFDALAATANSTIDVFAVVKPGLEYGLSQLSVGHQGGVPVSLVPNFPTLPAALPAFKYSASDGLLHIGVWASSAGAWKNLGTQLLAACGLPNVVLHVMRSLMKAFAWMSSCRARVVVESAFLPHAAFLAKLARIDIVMYASLTECSPMVVVEAASLGVPALISRTHRLFEGPPGSPADVIASALTVSEHDNPQAVQERLVDVASRLHELAPLLRAHMECLRARAERAWSGVLLPRTALDARRLFLFAAAEGDQQQPPQECHAGAYELSAAKPLVLSGALNTLPSMSGHGDTRRKGHFAFLTYELAPVTPGGAGVLIAALIDALLSAGHEVTVLAHMDAQACKQWADERSSNGIPSELLHVLHVPTLIEKEGVLGSEPDHELLYHDRAVAMSMRSCGNVFLRRASDFAVATRIANEMSTPFDVVEVFDYAGVGADLVRQHALPRHVPTVVRIHGSLELIDAAECVAVDNPSTVCSFGEGYKRKPSSIEPSAAIASDRYLMHLLERSALAGAHAILAPSMAMAALYSSSYGLPLSRFVVSPPPMARILKGASSSPTTHNAPVRLSSSSSEISLLVYGRLDAVKDPHTVAAAAAAIVAGLPTRIALRLIFAGADARCAVHCSRSVRSCIESSLPKSVSSIFLGHVNRKTISDLATTTHAAIVASRFEAFGLAAHELSAAGFPLIISDATAFTPFFNSSNSYVFMAGNASSLATAVLDLISDALSGTPLRHASPTYGDPVEPYERLLDSGRTAAAENASGKAISSILFAPRRQSSLLRAAMAQAERDIVENSCS